MSFALHLHTGMNLEPAIDMIRVDTLIDVAGISSDDAVDVLIGDGRGWKKVGKGGDIYYEPYVAAKEHQKLEWIGQPYRVLTIHNGWFYLCPPTYSATPVQRMQPHAYANEVWGHNRDPRPHSCFICTKVWDIKRFGS